MTALPCFYFFFSKFLLHSFSQHSPVTHQPEPRISPSASRDKGRTCPEAADARTTHPWRSHRPPEQVIPLTCRLRNLEKGFTQLLITLVLEYRRYSVSHYQGGEKKKKHRSQYCSQFQTGSFSASEELFRRKKQNHPKSHEGSCLLLQPSFFFFLTRLQKLRLVVTLPPYQTGLLHLRCCPHQLREVFPVGVTAETPLGSSAAASGTKKTPPGDAWPTRSPTFTTRFAKRGAPLGRNLTPGVPPLPGTSPPKGKENHKQARHRAGLLPAETKPGTPRAPLNSMKQPDHPS